MDADTCTENFLHSKIVRYEVGIRADHHIKDIAYTDIEMISEVLNGSLNLDHTHFVGKFLI